MNNLVDLPILAHYTQLQRLQEMDKHIPIEVKREFRKKKEEARNILTPLLLEDENVSAFLHVIKHPLVDKSYKNILRGVESREHLEEKRKTIKTPEDLTLFQQIVPSLLYTPRDQAYYEAEMERYTIGDKLPNPPRELSQLVFVVDFDEARGLNRTREELIHMVKADGTSPLCVVPTRTPGCYQMWFALDVPTFWYLRPNWQWGADTAYHRGVLSWNPVYRTFSPNRRGETTWWNPRIAQGWTPYTDPQIFQEFARNFKREPREGEESTNTSGRRLTTLQIIELMKNTIPGKGKRNENLFRYVQHFQALKARELGCHPTLEDHRRIAFDGNSLYSQPHPYIQVEQIAKWFFNHPVYKKQQNTARKRRPKSQLKVSQVFECLDALTVLQLIWKVKPTVSDGGIFCRYGQPIIHPMYEKYKNTLWFSKPGTPRHLAEVDGRWSVKTINQYLRLYKDVYENHPKAHEVKEVWDGGVERV